MCTGVRFSDDEGNTYFGRNLDWSFSYGETILVTPRGYRYDTVFGAGGKAKPNAVIGVGVVMADRPMYFDCANEHGLAIAGLNFPGYASFVHEPVEGTENVATFEFPLWVARNFDSVDEDDEGNTYFGRNLDWSFSYGETILVTPRGYRYDTVFGAGGKAKPNAVIGVGVVMADRPMYFDCANEHGLAIAGLNFPGYASFVHEPVEGTENVATFEFPLWVARNFDSVDEVEKALRNVTLVSQIVPGQQESLLHWFIGDGKRSIVVEQMADGMHVHHDDVDVLTNQPTFDFHMENLRNYMCVSNEMAEPTSWGKASLTAWGAGVGMHGIPGDVSSPSRFVRVAYTNAHYPQQNDEAANVSRLFHTLGSVQMVDGMAKMGDGQFERTLFTSGYSSKTNTYYMNTYDDPAIRSYAMADYDMDSSELISVAR